MILNMEHLPRVIPVGVQTESGVEAIGFDLSPWMTRWPGMTFAVWPTRPGESASYIAADIELVGNVLYWYPNAADTEKEGAGTVEVVGIGGGKCKSSGVIDTLVKKTSLDVTQETPEPFKPWFDSVLQAADAIRENVDVGNGGLYLVNAVVVPGEPLKVDRTQEEVREAVRQGKTVLMVDNNGRVWTYVDDDGKPRFYGGVIRTTVDSMHKYQLEYRSIGEDQTVRIGTSAYIKAASPRTLTIHQGNSVHEYDGSKSINISIPQGGGIPDPGQPHMQLVSDEDGKAVWEERLAYKHVQSGMVTLFAEETLMVDPEDPGMYFSATPLRAMPEVGKTYEVTINGTVYNTTAHPAEEDGVQIAVILGNAGNMNPEVYPDTGEPFMLVVPLPEHQAMMGGMSVIMATDIATDSIALSIKGQATITTIKKIDPEYIPDTHKTITLTIDADGNVTSDTTFAEAWAMTTGELQAAIVIKESSAYKGTTYTTADTVAKVENQVMGNFIDIRLRQGWVDTADFADNDSIRYLMWKTDNQIFIDDKQLNALPIMTKSDALKGCYLRYNGKSWEHATIDQLKADLGLT